LQLDVIVLSRRANSELRGIVKSAGEFNRATLTKFSNLSGRSESTKNGIGILWRYGRPFDRVGFPVQVDHRRMTRAQTQAFRALSNNQSEQVIYVVFGTQIPWTLRTQGECVDFRPC
jgi:hypothetical protein